MTSHPRVGVAAIIYNSLGEIIVGKRQGSHGAGTWALPGGHLEYGEEIAACAERETLEETGLRVRAGKISSVTNGVFEDVGKHYVTLFVDCEMADPDAQPQVLEPDKCEGWHWRTWADLEELLPHGTGEQGERLFLPLERLIQERRDMENKKGTAAGTD